MILQILPTTVRVSYFIVSPPKKTVSFLAYDYTHHIEIRKSTNIKYHIWQILSISILPASADWIRMWRFLAFRTLTLTSPFDYHKYKTHSSQDVLKDIENINSHSITSVDWINLNEVIHRTKPRISTTKIYHYRHWMSITKHSN